MNRKYYTIFSMVIGFLGFVIVLHYLGWGVILGLTLLLWGNNIQIYMTERRN